jgi:hypothetical protein
MVLKIMAFATTIGTATTLTPVATLDIPVSHEIVSLPSAGMPSPEIFLTSLSFVEAAQHIWHDIAWDALALGTKQLYAL